jgi:hypothetical protein
MSDAALSESWAGVPSCAQATSLAAGEARGTRCTRGRERRADVACSTRSGGQNSGARCGSNGSTMWSSCTKARRNRRLPASTGEGNSSGDFAQSSRISSNLAGQTKGPSEVLRKELERRWLLGQEEVSRVTALRDVHDRTRGEGLHKRENTWMEGIIESGGDPHRLAGKR